MENFKIDLFDEKELIEHYNTNKTNINFTNTEQLIFSLFNSNEVNISITDKVYEQDILLRAQNNEFISGDGYFYDANTLSTFKNAFKESVNPDGSITYIDCSITNYRKLEKEKCDLNDLIYLSEKDTEIYINAKAESLYEKLGELGLEVIGFSGIQEPTREIDLASSVTKIFIFNISIPNKKKFTSTVIKYLENKVIEIQDKSSKIRGYSIKKLKSELLKKIKSLDEKFGTEGNNILVENSLKTDYFDLILLLLHLDEIIKINDLDIFGKECRVDIVGYGKDKGIYFDKNNGNVFKEGIKLGTIKEPRQLKFFEYLYDNIGVHKKHKEIVLEGIGRAKVDTYGGYLSGIKKDLPKPIKELIEGRNGGYIME